MNSNFNSLPQSVRVAFEKENCVNLEVSKLNTIQGNKSELEKISSFSPKCNQSFLLPFILFLQDSRTIYKHEEYCDEILKINPNRLQFANKYVCYNVSSYYLEKRLIFLHHSKRFRGLNFKAE